MAKQEVIANSKAAAFLPISACRKKCRRTAQGRVQPQNEPGNFQRFQRRGQRIL